LARILIINMLRDSMQLEKIDHLLKYINGKIKNEEDNIIPESKLYGYICSIVDKITDSDTENSEDDLRKYITDCTSDYDEVVSGARKRLNKSLEVIVTAYYATLLKKHSNKLFDNIMR